MRRVLARIAVLSAIGIAASVWLTAQSRFPALGTMSLSGTIGSMVDTRNYTLAIHVPTTAGTNNPGDHARKAIAIVNDTAGATRRVDIELSDTGSFYLENGDAGTATIFNSSANNVWELSALLIDGTSSFTGLSSFNAEADINAKMVGSYAITNTNSANQLTAYSLNSQVTETNLVASNGLFTLRSDSAFGVGGVASIGTLQNWTTGIAVKGAGSASNEYTPLFNYLRFDLGTGYTQAIAPIGRGWLADWGVHGPIAVQPNTLNGLVLFANNNYNGSPADSASGGIWITTQKGTGAGTDATHQAANTFAMDVGLGITGTSNNGSAQIGWTTGIQIGGSGSPWNEASSKIGTGMLIRDYNTAGITFSNIGTSTAPDITFAGFFQGTEMTAPAAPAADGYRIFAVDNGSGKTVLKVIFNSGAAQVLATQP